MLGQIYASDGVCRDEQTKLSRLYTLKVYKFFIFF